MSKVILQNDVKNAIVVNLRKKFPDAKFYKDGTIKSYPCFYISFTSILSELISLNSLDTYRLKFFIRVEYRESEEPSRVNDLNSRLDEVGMTLLRCLKDINVYEKKYKLEITNNEIIDNVRVFEGNFSMIANFSEIEIKSEKMRVLNQKAKLKNEQ